MSKLHEAHIELVEAVNEAVGFEKLLATWKLNGFRDAVKILRPEFYGNFLMSADLHYIDQGIDRPMCCGVFLDNDD